MVQLEDLIYRTREIVSIVETHRGTDAMDKRNILERDIRSIVLLDDLNYWNERRSLK
jgi:hypothetical protein